MHWVQCKIFKLLYLGHFLTDLLRVCEENNQRNYGYKNYTQTEVARTSGYISKFSPSPIEIAYTKSIYTLISTKPLGSSQSNFNTKILQPFGSRMQNQNEIDRKGTK